MQDAIQLLKQDHKVLKRLLGELVDTTSRATSKRPELLAEVGQLLRAHTKVEEEIFYPAFRAAAEESDDERMFHEALEEHRAVELLVLPDLERTDPGSTEFGGRVKVLKELVLHHAEEEEDELFPRARELLGRDALKELGQRMEHRKQELEGASARR